MSDQSNIDKLFREGLGNPSQHAFNESAWENMNSMLNEREKFSWMSVGKLASAAIFLSTVFLGSNNPDVELLSKNDISTQKATVISSPLLAKNTIRPIANTSSDLKAQSGDGVIQNSENTEKLDYTDNTEKILIATTEEKASWVIEEELVSAPKSVSLNESNIQVENSGELQRETVDHVNISDIGRITPTSLEVIDVEFAEYGFDPVDNSSLPKGNIQSLSVFGGITLENGLASAGQIPAVNLLYTAGFYYNVEVLENISLSTGLGYRSKSGKGIELSRTQTQYGFGKSETTEKLALNRLHYIDLPLEVQYNIKGKHSIFGGASISYLAGVKSALATTHAESLSSTTSSTENTWDYEDGLNKWDAGVRAGYEYNLNKNLAIGGMVQYGLMDITSNETFEVQDKSKNMEVRVTLKYTPFRF